MASTTEAEVTELIRDMMARGNQAAARTLADVVANDTTSLDVKAMIWSANSAAFNHGTCAFWGAIAETHNKEAVAQLDAIVNVMETGDDKSSAAAAAEAMTSLWKADATPADVKARILGVFAVANSKYPEARNVGMDLFRAIAETHTSEVLKQLDAIINVLGEDAHKDVAERAAKALANLCKANATPADARAKIFDSNVAALTSEKFQARRAACIFWGSMAETHTSEMLTQLDAIIKVMDEDGSEYCSLEAGKAVISLWKADATPADVKVRILGALASPKAKQWGARVAFMIFIRDLVETHIKAVLTQLDAIVKVMEEDDSQQVRYRAALALASLWKAEATPADAKARLISVFRAANSKHWDARTFGMSFFGELVETHNSEVVEQLDVIIKAMEEDEDVSVRGAAADTLAKLCNADATPADAKAKIFDSIKAALTSEKFQARRAACFFWGSMAETRTSEMLTQLDAIIKVMDEDEDAGVRRVAADTLAKLCNADATPADAKAMVAEALRRRENQAVGGP